ncbi:outer membrane protein assembly factor BamB family protein [Geodermatophilus marinus]|uniref:outer membrane protein assembly factor BamB family protein n=1 Tax=Geodermatophilus sp. LHW52908 TaxID=2303986 RepID=UPI001F371823|nr:PQQ-binding-like beta-propeller repeat protein [Geodermatophilus sp. LHW52908]
MRPPLRVWAWTAAALALVVAAALLWRGSDAAATVSTTAPAVEAPAGDLPATLGVRWTAQATGPVDVAGARALVAGPHGVRALDPVTGAEAWRYTRANARLCDAVVVDGRVVAVFRTTGRCDEAVALEAGTGVRAWTRNVTYEAGVRLHATGGVVLAVGSTGVVTLDPGAGGTRWRQSTPEGCTVGGADAGPAGVVVLQHCDRTAPPQLRLFDAFDGTPRWTRDLTDPTSTLAAVSELVVVAGDTGVEFLAAPDGSPTGTLDAGGDDVLVSAVGDTTLVLADGTVSAVDPAGAVRWEAPAEGLPSPSPQAPADGVVAVPEAGAVVLRDLAGGAQTGRSAAPGLAGAGLVDRLGPVLLTRQADRVTTWG